MSRQVKILVEVPESIVGETVETVWAKETTDGYRLLNSPWYAKGISYLDVVAATEISEGVYQLDQKVATAGHSTYRLLIEDQHRWQAYWPPLQSMGCTFEESTQNGFGLLAVDLPPECDIHTAYTLMEAGESAGVWDFEEADVNHPVGPPR